METVAPFKEAEEEIEEAGGADSCGLCYQCGKCDVVCPWNRVRDFSIRKIVREAMFDDMNISAALAALFRLVRQSNYLMAQGRLHREDAQDVEAALRLFDSSGHRRIAVVEESDPTTVIAWANHIDALNAFNQALIEAGIEEHK